MDTPFDVLGSASFLVQDRRKTARTMVSALGFGEPKPHWHIENGPIGMSVTFMRGAAPIHLGPTVLELVQVEPLDPARKHGQPQIAAIAKSQEARPVRVHATDVASPDIDRDLRRLRAARIRHWVHTDAIGNRRVWIGLNPEDQTDYRRTDDAGLHMEILPTEALRLPPTCIQQDLAPVDLPDGAIVRVVYRTYLVDDLVATVGTLAKLFGWEPEAPIRVGPDGTRWAVFGFRMANSARLLLLQPFPGSEEGRALASWGPGPWSITMGVQGLGAKLEDLRERGTAFRIVSGSNGTGTVIRVDADAVPDCLFDFVELTSVDGMIA